MVRAFALYIFIGCSYDLMCHAFMAHLGQKCSQQSILYRNEIANEGIAKVDLGKSTRLSYLLKVLFTHVDLRTPISYIYTPTHAGSNNNYYNHNYCCLKSLFQMLLFRAFLYNNYNNIIMYILLLYNIIYIIILYLFRLI